MKCDAYIRVERQWVRCTVPAAEMVVVNGVAFYYCAPHVDHFITVLPAGSWTREPM